MLVLAASVAFAGSASLAALRLLTRSDKIHPRSYVFITRTFWLHLLAHGIAAVVPFPVYWFWPTNWAPLLTASPWFVAIASPLFINGMVILQGLDIPNATGPLSQFSDAVRKDFEQRMRDEQFAAMRGFIAPYAGGVAYDEAYALALANIPLQMSEDEANIFQQAIRTVRTAEEVMELYIRHIGMNSFRFVYQKKNAEELAQLLLFPKRSADHELIDSPPRHRDHTNR
jgi:hypothetical protein